MRLTRLSPNKNAFHIAFHDDYGNLVTEHIPTETSRLYSYFALKYKLLLIKLGWNLYYWHLRYMLDYHDKKTEDLRFIDHVFQDHDGRPSTFRERWFFERYMSKYGTEYHQLAKFVFQTQRDKTYIDHPYTKAYIKMWHLNREPQWKTLYHGVDGGEFIHCVNLLIKSYDVRSSRFKKRKQRAEKKLQAKG